MSIGRQTHHNLVHYLRGSISFDSTGASTGVLIGTLPAGAHVLQTSVNVKTAFDAGSTNVLVVGTNSSSYNDLMGTATVTEGTPGYYASAPVAAITKPTADLPVYAKYTQTGTAATAGAAEIVVTYVPDNAQYA